MLDVQEEAVKLKSRGDRLMINHLAGAPGVYSGCLQGPASVTAQKVADRLEESRDHNMHLTNLLPSSCLKPALVLTDQT